MQKEDEKVELKVTPGEQPADMPARAAEEKASDEPPPAVSEVERFNFRSWLGSIRMMEINQIGIISICVVIAMLLSAYLEPMLDKQLNFDASALNARIAAETQKAHQLESTLSPSDGKGWSALGLRYYLGDRVKASRDAALRCYKKAAAAGDPEGMYMLGALTASTRSKEDHNASVRLITQAAALGNPVAAESLDWNAKRNYSVIGMYKKLADQGDINATWGLMRLREDKRYFDKLREAAARGDVLAQYVVGSRLAQGTWPEHWLKFAPYRSYAMNDDRSEFFKGLELLKLAAEKEFAPAQIALSETYGGYAAVRDYSDDSPMLTPQQYNWQVQQRSHADLSRAWLERARLHDSYMANVRLFFQNRWAREGPDLNTALEAARKMVAWRCFDQIDELCQTLAKNDQHELVYEVETTALGSSPKDFEKDLDTLILSYDASVTSKLMGGIAAQLAAGEGVKQNIPLARRVMVVRGKLCGADFLSEAADFLTKYGGTDGEIIALYKQAGTPNAEHKLRTFLERQAAKKSSGH
jgi:TPR repeat protein